MAGSKARSVLVGVQPPRVSSCREQLGVTLVVGPEGLVSHGLDGKVAVVPAATGIVRASPSSVWAGMNRRFPLHCFGFMQGISFSTAAAPGRCSSP